LSLFTCCHCGTIYSYCRHLKQYHENESGFRIGCNFESCKSLYPKVNSFVKHVVHCHKSVVSHALQDSESTCTMNNDSSNNSNDETVPVASDSSCTCGSEPMVTEKCTNVDQVFANIEHHCASFVLGLREKHMIPSVVQDEVVSSVKHLLSQALVDYRDVISSELQNGAPGYTMSAQLFSVLDIERHCDFCDSGITHSVIWNETDGFQLKTGNST